MSRRDSFTWTSYTITHVGLVRKSNEDSHIDRDDIGLWAVADGMGGHEAGALSSKTVVEALAQLEKPALLSTFVDEVEDKLISVNTQLRTLAHQHHNDRTIGSTLVALLGWEQHCIVIWAGDSRAYLCRNGTLQQLTRDHSEVEELVRHGIILREQAESHPSGNVITRAIGAFDNLYLDIDAEGIQSGDTFLLCSDGLTRHISDEEIRAFLVKEDIHEIGDELLELTLERGAKDNVTVTVIRAV